MGDCRQTPIGKTRILWFICLLIAENVWSFCLRPYHVECSRSRSISEDKLRRARLVLRWVTAWEHRVLQALFFARYRQRTCSTIKTPGGVFDLHEVEKSSAF
ncbi:hypothetical protein RvY_10792 [Ramazzottius varieornatus]|uniref:Uncharacterized protein n=1 Tax=Ramazzottius varieornatus TaxID=947166 RepID=A0A1D1VIF1_RAMVA|nr:hypothetical protein RvY_10792 [Ramazzottius varieornatus]